ncbi:WPP domain-associated protein-like isoform X2 [Phoenix dactylifera]|uniref:WPP domain-associated protein-like isoform X2 n=1 Tax=Phoenix dactylifera TaxID=42345 RepID=A0A8B7CGX2_PHODC|nr:WPP domain-associated protein-like isoform X2 [Phoenix dactylifera]
MQVSMENSEVLNAGSLLSMDDSAILSCNHNGSDTVGNDSAVYEKFLLDDLDSYMNDINSRLTVSRMVSDSVIKGIVNAVTEEASEKIASKQTEIAVLYERLQHYESALAEGNRLDSSTMMPEASIPIRKPQRRKTELHQQSLNEEVDCDYYTKNFGSLKFAAEEHLQRLKEELRDVRNMISFNKINWCSKDIELYSIQGKTMEKLHVVDGYADALEVLLAALCEPADSTCFSLKPMLSEHGKKWEQEIQREVRDIIIQGFDRELQDEFETRLSEKRSLVNTLNKNLQKMVDEFSTIHQELDAIAMPLFSSDFGPLISYYGLEGLEEWSTLKRKDHLPRKVLGNHHIAHTSHCEESGNVSEKCGDSVKPTLTDSPQLKCMTKDELMTYYKTEMTNMKRQHDLALQEKTEELFSLKREFLKEKGSNPSHFRKDKEFELLRKKVVEFISKLNEIILENENLPIIHNDQDMFLGLKERMYTLFFENQRLQSFLEQKRKEVACSEVSNETNQTLHCSSIEEKFSEQIKKLKLDIEDIKLEASIRDEIQKIILREWVGELIDDMECLDMECLDDTYSTIYRKSIEDVIARANHIIVKCDKEKNSIAGALVEKEKVLCLEIEANNKLKHEIASLSTLMKAKEKFALETESKLMQQKEHLVNMLRDQVSKQDLYIQESNKECDSVKGRLDETLQQIHQYEVEVAELNQKLKLVSDALEEAEKQKHILQGIVEEKQEMLASTISKEERHKKGMESMVVSMRELSKAILDCERRMASSLETNESRLKILSHQCGQLVQQANFVKRKALWYKQGFERRCSDLQKAETEVDLLGDDVDALLHLLEKIYIALEHYSPVLQHYPGVMEILKLIRREMKRESTK